MIRDIAAVMVTVDRTPQQNYLRQTIENLGRAGLYDNERLIRAPEVAAPLFLSDSGPADSSGKWAGDITDDYKYHVCLNSCTEGRCANMNVANALRVGASMGRGDHWVLFMEDDIDVCADFFDSVGRWLDDHAAADVLVYAFGCAYPDVAHQVGRGATGWHYAIERFYGTQCFAIRSTRASSLANFLEGHCYSRTPDGTAYDLLMSDWALQQPGAERYFMASCPSFVQHIGATSVIRPRPNVHTFASFPGHDWSYSPALESREVAL